MPSTAATCASRTTSYAARALPTAARSRASACSRSSSRRRAPSSTTSVFGSISLSPGAAWGFAPFGPLRPPCRSSGGRRRLRASASAAATRARARCGRPTSPGRARGTRGRGTRRAPHLRDLRLVLDRAERLDDPGRRDEVDPAAARACTASTGARRPRTRCGPRASRPGPHQRPRRAPPSRRAEMLGART